MKKIYFLGKKNRPGVGSDLEYVIRNALSMFKALNKGCK